ncbi:hypothetical protein GWI33_009683 [Rhynchophorus ferrugineus]|uniref:Uncharacterized protein n=1 Tax=Rhynchophorus ferrugineus TaxID=354439 RepID=A0A834ID91_RHYFE|nr:hypothetical protein GWI33_009683 [Rhynchophorus ferrugineus]
MEQLKDRTIEQLHRSRSKRETKKSSVNLRRYAETLKCSGLQRWLKEHRRITPKISTHDIQYQTDPNIGQKYAGQIPRQTQYAGESISRGTVKGESMLKDVQGDGDVTINRKCPEPDKKAKFMKCDQITERWRLGKWEINGTKKKKNHAKGKGKKTRELQLNIDQRIAAHDMLLQTTAEEETAIILRQKTQP